MKPAITRVHYLNRGALTPLCKAKGGVSVTHDWRSVTCRECAKLMDPKVFVVNHNKET